MADWVIGELRQSGSPRLPEPPDLSRTGPAIQRAAADSGDQTAAAGAPASASGSLIVADEAAAIAPQQMTKSEFLAQLRASICAATDAILAASGRSTEGCPYLDFWFGYYRAQDASHIERAIQKYAPDSAGAGSAKDYIPLITDRVRSAVSVWAATGKITGVPENISIGQNGSTQASPVNGTSGPSERVSFKTQGGEPRGTDDPAAIRAQLTTGRSLDTPVKNRMESAFGVDFSRVRVHTDAAASGLSARLNARAFTIGHDVAFGGGEYQPGTLLGDALIAHELAHVVQQAGGSTTTAPMAAGDGSYNALEHDADVSALGAVASIWGMARGSLAGIARNVMPQLRSGLRLQGCTRSVKRCPPGKHWDLAGPATGAGPTCICVWRCMPGAPVTGPEPSGPTLQCDPPGSCPPPPRPEIVDDSYTIQDQGSVIGAGGHFTPVDGPAACGCFPLDVEGKRTGTPIVPTTLELTDVAGPLVAARANRITPEETTENRPRAAIVEEQTPGGGRTGEAPGKASGGVPAPRPQTAIVEEPPANGASAGAAPRTTPSATSPPAPPEQTTPSSPPPQQTAATTPTQQTAPPPGNVPPRPQSTSDGPGRPPSGGIRYVTVKGDEVIVDTNIARALDKAAKDPTLGSLQENEKLMVQEARKQGIVATPTVVGQLGEKGGAQGTISTTQEVSVPPAKRAAIVRALEDNSVGGPPGKPQAASDREIVTQAILAKTDGSAPPTYISADNGVINGLARIAATADPTFPAPNKLGRYRNIAEYLQYEPLTPIRSS